MIDRGPDYLRLETAAFAVMRRNGDVFTVAVDPEDYERVMAAGPWRIRPHGRTFYALRNVRRADGSRTVQKLHQFLGFHGGDHIDGDGLNNCKSNLRLATNAENHQNRRARRGSTSGVRGVYWHRATGKWQASVRLAGRQLHFGYYNSKADAAQAASEARARLMPFSADARAKERDGFRCAGEPVAHREDGSPWGNGEAVAGLDDKRGVFSRDSCAASAPGSCDSGGLSSIPEVK